MARGIKLRRYKIAHANHLAIHGFRLRVEVVAEGPEEEVSAFIAAVEEA